MKNMFLDIETYSENPIKNGVRKYVDTDSFRILLLSYAVDDGEVQLIDLTKEDLPQDVRSMLTNPDYCKRAFNANFEMTCIGHVWPELIIEEQWSCDQALSTYNSLPPSLAGVGVALKLPQDKKKDTRGKALIKYFCNPCKPTKTNGERTRNLPEHDPEKWTEFCEYNKQDVVTERAVFDALKDNQPPKAEHDLWLLDGHINERGIRIDTQLAANAIKMSDTLTERGMKRLSDITGLDNPNSVTKLRERLKYLDCPMPSLSKDVVMEKLKDPELNDVAREVLTLRLALGKSSVKKYQAMMDTVTSDGRAHNLFQFYGASHTGRWAGRNVQLQNLPRNYIEDLDDARKIVKSGDLEMLGMFYENPMDIISQLIRTALIPADGNKFIVADFSAIEARVIAWLSGEKWRMEAFAQGKDIYCESASQMFHCNVVKHGENGHLRQKGKIAELALGYGGGVGALKAMDTSHSIDEGEMQDIVDRWRDASPRIPMLWKQLESVAMACIKRYQSGMRDIRTKNLTAIQGVSFEMTNDGNLLLHLPSGRSLSYREAHIGENRFGGESIVYLGANQVTRDWDDVETYGGKLTENLVQAVARDCLAEAMTRLEAAGYHIVAHIHDEVVLDVPNTSQYTLADAIRIMTQNEPWNEGLIMNADGFEGEYYKKD